MNSVGEGRWAAGEGANEKDSGMKERSTSPTENEELELERGDGPEFSLRGVGGRISG